MNPIVHTAGEEALTLQIRRVGSSSQVTQYPIFPACSLRCSQGNLRPSVTSTGAWPCSSSKSEQPEQGVSMIITPQGDIPEPSG